MQDDWKKELERNGLSCAVEPPPPAGSARDGVTCPACGTTAPLVDGACADCGLVLG
ncbi:MAG: hypothetical protein M0R80_28165 [Proteobacteria bacterium]|nr:hypothetical protein [Pseudomonadota bacterium]